MSVTALNEIESQQVSGQTGYHRSYRSVYQAITNDVTDSAVDVVLDTRAAGDLYLPQRGDYYVWGNTYDLAAIVIGEPDIKLRDVSKTRKVWDVMVTHTTQTNWRSTSTRYENPLDEPWRVRLLSDEWTEEVLIDPTTGEALTNSAKQPLTGKLTEIYRSRSRWMLTKNRPTLDQDLIDYSRGRVNSVAVTLRGRMYAPRTLLLRNVEAEELVNPYGGTYARFDFSLDTNEETFDIVAPDRGTKEYIGTNRDDQEHYGYIPDPKTRQPIEPPGLYLDGNGNVMQGYFLRTQGPTLIVNSLGRYPRKYPEADLNVWQFPA